jgi:hypothetical protein
LKRWNKLLNRKTYPYPQLVIMTKLDYISLFLIFFSVITIILGIIKIHTYPGKVAKARKHPQEKAIEVTSLLGLIVFPLWMLALVWAYSGAVIGVMYTETDDKPATAPLEKGDEPPAAPDETDGKTAEKPVA